MTRALGRQQAIAQSLKRDVRVLHARSLEKVQLRRGLGSGVAAIVRPGSREAQRSRRSSHLMAADSLIAVMTTRRSARPHLYLHRLDPRSRKSSRIQHLPSPAGLRPGIAGRIQNLADSRIPLGVIAASARTTKASANITSILISALPDRAGRGQCFTHKNCESRRNALRQPRVQDP